MRGRSTDVDVQQETWIHLHRSKREKMRESGTGGRGNLVEIKTALNTLSGVIGIRDLCYLGR